MRSPSQSSVNASEEEVNNMISTTLGSVGDANTSFAKTFSGQVNLN